MTEEVQIIGASGYTNEDITKVVGHLSNPAIKNGFFVIQVFKLDDIQEAFDIAVAINGAIKIMVDLK